MAEINWKSKYNEIKAKYISDVDTAFRLGIEQGTQMAQQQAAQEQQAEEQAMQEAAAGGQQPGQEGALQEGGEQPGSQHPEGSELDQHISQLEGMLGKSELTADDLATLKKSLASIKFGIEMKKSDAAVKGIAAALKPKLAAPAATMNKSAEANLSSSQKAALTAQQTIVSNIMSAWDSEQGDLTKSIKDIVASAGRKE